jgi:hypothetical protein
MRPRGSRATRRARRLDNGQAAFASRVRARPRGAIGAWQVVCSLPFVINHDAKRIDPMTTDSEFYNEQKWCEGCKKYVRFLMSVNFSYCVDCGGRVRLFSRHDSKDFQDTVQRHKWQAS